MPILNTKSTTLSNMLTLMCTMCTFILPCGRIESFQHVFFYEGSSLDCRGLLVFLLSKLNRGIIVNGAMMQTRVGSGEVVDEIRLLGLMVVILCPNFQNFFYFLLILAFDPANQPHGRASALRLIIDSIRIGIDEGANDLGRCPEVAGHVDGQPSLVVPGRCRARIGR